MVTIDNRVNVFLITDLGDFFIFIRTSYHQLDELQKYLGFDDSYTALGNVSLANKKFFFIEMSKEGIGDNKITVSCEDKELLLKVCEKIASIPGITII
jgi:hypothetical protein